jgi:FkbM family methyltransferase
MGWPEFKHRIRRLPGVVGAWEWARRRPRKEVPPGSVVEVRVPGARPFWMHLLEGRDQIARDIQLNGVEAFENPVPDVFALCVAAAGGLVVDVGANTGFYGLLAAASSRRARIHAFEPLAEVADALSKNVWLNRRERRTRLCSEALGDVIGEVPLYMPDGSHGLIETSASLDPEFKEHLGGFVTVPATSLDAHLARHSHLHVSVLKIDVEGQEHRVLRGAEKVLSADRPLVFYEILPRADVETISALARRLGYVDVRLRPDLALVGCPPAFDENAWNHMLIPAEAVERWLSIIGRRLPSRWASEAEATGQGGPPADSRTG